METVSKVCQSCKNPFQIDESDFAFYEKMEVPPPTWCPECRMIRRMAFWNEKNFFKKKDVNGREMLSTFPEESPVKIVERDLWWRDEFEATDYGREYDFSKPFFEQFRDLLFTVPFPARAGTTMVNSDYCNNSNNMKDCYMCFNCTTCEDSLYLVYVGPAKDCMDVLTCGEIESCYEVFQTGPSYQVFFSTRAWNSKESYFINHVFNSTNCFGCVNLKNKQYYIFNKPYSKEEYFEKLKEFDLGSYRKLTETKDRSNKFALEFPYHYMNIGAKSTNATGDAIFFSKDIKHSFCVGGGENVRYSQNTYMNIKDCADYTNWGANAELVYESVECGDGIHNIKFCYGCAGGSRDLEYSAACIATEDSFGCVGLRKKKYCILNRQYSKEEYKKLREKIIEHMKKMPYKDKQGRVYTYGEFFPMDMAPFAANETALMDWSDLNKEKAIQHGLTWREIKPSQYKATMKAEDLPDHIKDVPDTITGETILCFDCKAAYRIIPKELDFYRRFNLALPRLCFNCRHKNRTKLRNLPRLYDRYCTCAGTLSENKVYNNIFEHFHGTESCKVKFQSPYAPDNPKIIYCEPCWLKELV